MKIYNGNFVVEYKDDNTPLTQADKNANEVITIHLAASGISVISEESKEIPYPIRKKWNACWIVDPLDGTKEFVKRNGEFTVNIALVEGGKPQLGVIYVPVEKLLYFGLVEKGKSFKVFVDPENPDPHTIINSAKEIRPSKTSKNKIRVVGSRSHMNEETLGFVEGLKKNFDSIEIVSIGSSLKFCLVAEGNADIYPRFAPTYEWDTAAGQAICEAVGLRVISVESNQYPCLQQRKFIESGFSSHKRIK
ncbi:MAG: 3'(2'),5'-bisphosphate nucleotidase CysQ [Flavobacteriaceae bacterium]|nr:3'(2'),5'-bisphosphate nucleotidase CysQ [Flavobacteriaceae bacterium]